MSEKKNVPELRFLEFSTLWKQQKLQDSFSNSRKKGDSSLPIYSVSQSKGLVPRDSLNRVIQKDAKSEQNLRVEPKDIAYNMMRMWQGAYGIAETTCMVSPAYVVLKPKKETVSKFFYFQFERTRTRYLFTTYSHGLTLDRLRLYFDDFGSIPASIPSLPEQQKIAEFLTAVDKRIALLEQKKGKLESYKKGVMQQLFTQKIRFKQDDGSEFPDWEEKKLGEVSNITTGSSNRQDSGLEGTYTFFDRSIDIRRSSIFLFDCEAVIVPGEGQDFIPKYFVGKFDLHQRTYAILDFKNCYGKYIFHFLDLDRRHLLSHAVGSTVKSLRLPMFQNLPLNLPCMEEQKKIISFLDILEMRLEATNYQIAQMQTWKKGLLQKMFI